jgi:hypothetical protein
MGNDGHHTGEPKPKKYTTIMKTKSNKETKKTTKTVPVSLPIIRSLGAGAILCFAAPAASAISITTGLTGGSGDVDNVLFDQDLRSGPLVRGSTNPADVLVDFTSTSGDLFAPASGQARLEALNAPFTFTQLCFDLTDGSTFTKAQLNVNSSESATDGITFSVFFEGSSSPFVSVFDLTASGQNMFTIMAEGSERISSICFDTTVPILDVKQVRIGGIERNPVTPVNPVPDGGTSAALLGLSLLGLGGLRMKLGRSRA